MVETIQTDNAPAAAGAYSQGRATDDLVFTAGQVARTPDGESLRDADVATQTEQVLENIAAVLEAGGADLDDVLKVTVFLRDIEDFDEMNETYEAFFGEELPARSAIEVGQPPAGMALEIEAVAAR
ncbi:MAG: Rid family detoxifying hydrolase [Salinirussus sp.]